MLVEVEFGTATLESNVTIHRVCPLTQGSQRNSFISSKRGHG